MAYCEIKTIKTERYDAEYKTEFVETYVDGDIFEIIERYYDRKDNQLIYEYVHDKTPGQLLKIGKEKEKPKKQESKKMKKLNKNKRRG